MSKLLPDNVRKGIYITVVLVSAVVSPLGIAGVLPPIYVAVWTSLAGAASGLAAYNVSNEDDV